MLSANLKNRYLYTGTTYDENAAKLLVDRIINSYITAFDELENNINKRYSEDFS